MMTILAILMFVICSAQCLQCLCQTSAASASKVWGVLRPTPCHYIHNTGDLFNLKRDPLWSPREACDLPMQCNGAPELQ